MNTINVTSQASESADAQITTKTVLSAHANNPSIQAGDLLVNVEGELASFRAALSLKTLSAQCMLVRLSLHSDTAASPPNIALSFDLPATDIHCRWMGNHSHKRLLEPNWANGGVDARACTAAPLICLYSESGVNRLCMAGSDPVHPSKMSAGLREENACFVCRVEPFMTRRAACTEISFELRIDLREHGIEQSIGETVQWWAEQPGLAPLRVPDVGRLPMYSTWYSFHQHLDVAAVEKQCALAKDLGCAAVIVDDGWQTMDGNRGYAYCGDWKPDRIPQMAEHVARIHDLDMQYILWYSVPFIGHHSKTHALFKGKYLRDDQRLETAVVDPRFPEIRDYLVSTYEAAVREWDLDGFKLDFVDSISLPDNVTPVAEGGRDIADVDEAVTQMLQEVVSRIQALKPDLLVEFRQSYVGPVMRSFGNLFRAGDCPNDAIGNRMRTLDIRLLCGSTACHSDMIMWHRDEPVESAALQMLNILFSVPQISVLIDQLPEAHQNMLRFWLQWWIQHRETLLDGTLSVKHPELSYTQAAASSNSEHIACAYSREIITVVPCPYIAVVNATRQAGIHIESLENLGTQRCRIKDVCGNVISDSDQNIQAGISSFAVPAAGLLEIGVLD